VFPARYVLIPYIKQITFRLLKVKAVLGLRKLVHVMKFRPVCRELLITYTTLIGNVVKISRTDREKNGEVLHNIREESNILYTVKRGARGCAVV
jgi:hypothetical protein